MNTKEELTNCPDCGTYPGQPHFGGCDVARCRNSGFQYISCSLREEDMYGDPIPDELASHHCVPDGWDGEWPGVKDCRRFGWYTTVKITDDKSIVTEDLNRLMMYCDWNIETQTWEKR